MKSVILTMERKIRASQFKEIEDCLLALGEVIILRCGEELNQSIFTKMREANPDVIISIDGTAFDFETEGGGCSLNILPCKVIHVILSREAYFRYDKDVILNLSHAVIVPMGDITIFSNQHSLIPNILGYSEETGGKAKALQEALKELWCI